MKGKLLRADSSDTLFCLGSLNLPEIFLDLAYVFYVSNFDTSFMTPLHVMIGRYLLKM